LADAIGKRPKALIGGGVHVGQYLVHRERRVAWQHALEAQARDIIVVPEFFA